MEEEEEEDEEEEEEEDEEEEEIEIEIETVYLAGLIFTCGGGFRILPPCFPACRKRRLRGNPPAPWVKGGLWGGRPCQPAPPRFPVWQRIPIMKIEPGGGLINPLLPGYVGGLWDRRGRRPLRHGRGVTPLAGVAADAAPTI